MKKWARKFRDLLYTAVLEGNSKESLVLVTTARKEGINGDGILLIIQESMKAVGERFEKGEYFLPEVLCSAEAAEKVIEAVSPDVEISHHAKRTKIVIGTVQGDIHDIGKNILVAVLRSAGHQVYDLGTDVSADKFVKELGRTKAKFLLMSALTTTTMPYMKKVTEMVEQEGLRDHIKIIIGGGPVTKDFAAQIHADGYGKNAFEALAKVNSMLARI